jgi:hypothetical protein
VKIWPFIVFFIVIVIFFRFIFVFKNIECQLNDASLESGVCDRINERFKGKSLFFSDLENDQIWDELLAHQEYSQVYQFEQINKSLSGHALLGLTAKLPDYRLIIGSDRYLLNQNNKLKNDQERLDLPTIELLDNLSANDHGYLQDDYHQKFLKLGQAITKHQIKTGGVKWVSNQEIHLFLDEIEVLLDDSKDFDLQMERLALIIREEELKEILLTKKILDMRFNLPVLKEF